MFKLIAPFARAAKETRESDIPLAGSISFVAWVFLGLVLAAVAAFLTPWRTGLDTDAATFAVIGERILAGGAPYRDIFDSKPPLFYLLNAASIGLGRLVGMQTVDGVRLLSLLSVVVTGLGMAQLVRHFGAGRVAMALSALGSALFFSGMSFANGGGLSEPPAFALALAAWVIAERSRSILMSGLAGILLMAGLAISFLVAPLGLGVILALRRRNASMSDYLACLSGVLLVAGGLLIYLELMQALPAAIDQLVIYNRAYASTSCPQANSPGWPCPPASSMYQLLNYGLLIAAVFIVPLLFVRWRRVDRLLPTSLLLALITLPSLSRAPTSHYFWPMLIGLLPLGALGAEQLWLKVRAASPFNWAVLVSSLWVAMLIFAIWGGTRITNVQQEWQHRLTQAKAQVTAELAHLPSDRTLFVWGKWSNLYLDSPRAMTGIMVNDFALMTPGYTSSATVQKVCMLLAEHRPIIIIDGTSLSLIPDSPVTDGLDKAWFEPLRQMVASHWRLQAHYGPIQILAPLDALRLDLDTCAPASTSKQ